MASSDGGDFSYFPAVWASVSPLSTVTVSAEVLKIKHQLANLNWCLNISVLTLSKGHTRVPALCCLNTKHHAIRMVNNIYLKNPPSMY